MTGGNVFDIVAVLRVFDVVGVLRVFDVGRYGQLNGWNF